MWRCQRRSSAQLGAVLQAWPLQELQLYARSDKDVPDVELQDFPTVPSLTTFHVHHLTTFHVHHLSPPASQAATRTWPACCTGTRATCRTSGCG